MSSEDSPHTELHTSVVSSLSLQEPLEVYDEFDERNCGEPMKQQNILLDFTETESDSSIIQKKCADFWNFIRRIPDIEDMMASPQPTVVDTISFMDLSSASIDPILKSQRPVGELKKERTAAEMFAFVQEKGFIEGKLSTRHRKPKLCLRSSEEYQVKENSINMLNKQVAKFENLPPSSMSVGELNLAMECWDKAHVKSMDPPKNPARFKNVTMQNLKYQEHNESKAK